MDLKQKVFTGSAFGAATQMIGLICRLVQGIILARLLSEKDFGLIAVSMALLEFANVLQGMGLEVTVIQKGIKRRELLDTAFTGQLILTSGMFTVFILVVAPLAGVWFRDSEVVQLVRVQSLLLLINAFSFVPRVVLQAVMNFRAASLSIVVGTLVATTVSVVAAHLWRNYWAIVAGAFAGNCISMIVLLRTSPYRIRFKFDRAVAKDLFRFSSYVLLLHLVAATGFQLDKLVGGRLLNTDTIGLYSQAYRWGMLAVTSAIPAVQPVLFAAYCQRKEEASKVRAAYRHSIFVLSLALVPCAMGLFLMGDEFVVHVLGERWLPAVWPMRLLALISLVRMMNSLTAPFIQALGRPDLQLRAEVFSKIAFLGTLLPLCKSFGLSGLGAAVAVHHLVNQAGMVLATKRLARTGMWEIVGAVKGPVLLGLLMIPSWYFLRITEHGLVGFLTTVVLVGGCYLLMFLVVYRIRSATELQELILGEKRWLDP